MGLSTSLPTPCTELQLATLLECHVTSEGAWRLQPHSMSSPFVIPTIFRPFCSASGLRLPHRMPNTNSTLLARYALQQRGPCNYQCLLVVESSQPFASLQEQRQQQQQQKGQHHLYLILLHRPGAVDYNLLNQHLYLLFSTTAQFLHNVRRLHLPPGLPGNRGTIRTAVLNVVLSHTGDVRIENQRTLQWVDPTQPAAADVVATLLASRCSHNDVLFPLEVSEDVPNLVILAATVVAPRTNAEEEEGQAVLFLVLQGLDVEARPTLRWICVRPESVADANLNLEAAVALAYTELFRFAGDRRPLGLAEVLTSLPDDWVHWHGLLQMYLRSLLPGDDRPLDSNGREQLRLFTAFLMRVDPGRINLQSRTATRSPREEAAAHATWVLLRRRAQHAEQWVQLVQAFAAPCLAHLVGHPVAYPDTLVPGAQPFADWLQKLLALPRRCVKPLVWRRVLPAFGRLSGGLMPGYKEQAIKPRSPDGPDCLLGRFAVVCEQLAHGHFNRDEQTPVCADLATYLDTPPPPPHHERIREVVGDVLWSCVDQCAVQVTEANAAAAAGGDSAVNLNAEIQVGMFVGGVLAMVQPLRLVISRERQRDILRCVQGVQALLSPD